MKLFTLLVLCVGLLFGAVDINTATKSELMSIKGIGDKKADTILKYRADNCFKNVEELTLVKGIGAKFIAKNKENLSASECKAK